ncbi:MAG TPA: hypothetical protein VFW23_05250, partial [Tepidisphaeraceae bacterium]|nr:hypothetical protein [Tepidisphaeraceae bacterium]
QKNEKYLVDRTPVASVGVVWSQQNADWFGRDNADTLVDQPFRGFTQALIRGRIPFIPVHLDHIEREATKLSTLVLPNIGAISDSQADAVRRFVHQGGSLIATGQTSLFDEWGDSRPDFALADVLGVSGGKGRQSIGSRTRNAGANDSRQTYLRLTPELRAKVDGPHTPGEPPAVGQRHPILAGFDETDILPFGGMLDPLSVANEAKVLCTFIPAFPAFAPEEAYMRTPRTDIPGLVVNSFGKGQSIYFAADIDQRYALDNLPDHGDLLANAARFAAGTTLPVQISGPGLLDCELYEQIGRLILHIVNLTSAGTWRAPVEELIPVGPVKVKVRLPNGIAPIFARALVSVEEKQIAIADGWANIELASVLDHEVLIIEV